ncbi:MAG: ribonuclease HII [Treponema sp.]|nr:ribonuclease HII [Treponema sp.]
MNTQDSNKIILTLGFDEAGRGPLAGPVSAAAVILPQDFPLDLLNDSKKLSHKKRAAAEKVIKEKACWGIGLVDHQTIDKINILQASLLAMKIAYENLNKNLKDWCLKNNIDFEKIYLTGITDGNQIPSVDFECRAEPKADGKYPQVMAASILAKECRDSIMIEMDKKYPEYGYAKHKGYPTREHKEICHRIGPSPIQRLSFKY